MNPPAKLTRPEPLGVHLRLTLHELRAHFSILAQLGAIVASITAGVQFVVLTGVIQLAPTALSDLEKAAQTGTMSAQQVTSYLVGLLALSVPTLIVSFATTGLFVWVIRHREKPQWPVNRWLKLTALWLVAFFGPITVLTLIGMQLGVADSTGRNFATFALIVGAIYAMWFSVKTAFAQYLISDQPYSPRAALRVSAALTKGQWGRTLIQIFFMNLLAAGASSLLLMFMPTNSFPSSGSTAGYIFIECATTWLATLVSAPIVAVGIGMLYLDLVGDE